MATPTTEPMMLKGLIESLKSAASYCNGLAHAQQRPVFLVLEQQLTALSETAVKMAMSPAPSRQAVLRQINGISKDAAGRVKH